MIGNLQAILGGSANLDGVEVPRLHDAARDMFVVLNPVTRSLWWRTSRTEYAQFWTVGWPP